MTSFLQSQYLELVQGDDYKAVDERAVIVKGIGVTWPAALSSVKLLVSAAQSGWADACTACPAPLLDIDGTYTAAQPTSAATAAFDVLRIQTLALASGVRAYTFEVRGLLASGGVVTLARGHVTVLAGAL